MATRKHHQYDKSVPHIFFVTFTVVDWLHVFISDQTCDLVYKWFAYMEKEYDNKIHGYVIMPNHIHLLLLVTPKSPPLSKLIQNAKRFLAYDLVKHFNGSHIEKQFTQHADLKKAKHKVWQDRYDAKLIENEDMFWQKLHYIHNNPVAKHWQLAKTPEDYEYSSAMNWLGESGTYPVDISPYS